MSETEHLIGKLIPVRVDEDVELVAADTLVELNEPRSKWYKTALDQLESDGYKKYVVMDGRIYKVEAKSEDPESDIFRATRNADGSFDFEVRYYNGGCSFTEAVERAIAKENV